MEEPGEPDEYGFRFYWDGSFLNDKGVLFDKYKNAEDGSYYDRFWNFHAARHRSAKPWDEYFEDPLLADFENQHEDDDEYDEHDEVYQEFLNQHGGKFEKDLKTHSFPATIVIWDLP